MINEIEITLMKYREQFTKRTKDMVELKWFSFPNDLLLHPDFFRITGEELKWFIWCASVCSKCNHETIRLDIDHACGVLKLNVSDFHSMVEKLKGKQIVVGSRPDDVHVAATARPLHNNTQHNNTNTLVFDFENAYGNYLVKVKGQNAEKNFNAQIKTMMDYQQLLNSMVNYKKYLAIKENSWRRPKQTFAAYLGTKSSGYFWRDWIDWQPEKSMPTKMASNTIKNEFERDLANAKANSSENGLENALDDATTKEIRERLLGNRKPKIDPMVAK